MKKNKQADQQAGIRAVRTHEAGALRDESRRTGRIGTGWSPSRSPIAHLVALALGAGVSVPVAAQIVANGRTATTVTTVGSVTDVTTATTSGVNAFNAFSQFVVNGGHTANLHLPGSTQNLINLVDSKTQINGTLNSLYSTGKIGGNVFFASPQGFVVGAGGVVNVGKLVVSTPTPEFVKQMIDGGFSDADATSLMNGTAPQSASGLITIQGKVNALDSVVLHAKSVSLDAGGQIIAGQAAVAPIAVNVGGAAVTGLAATAAGKIEIVADSATVAGTLTADRHTYADGGGILITATETIDIASTGQVKSVAAVGNASGAANVEIKAVNTVAGATGVNASVNVAGLIEGGNVKLTAQATDEQGSGQATANASVTLSGTIKAKNIDAKADVTASSKYTNDLTDMLVTTGIGALTGINFSTVAADADANVTIASGASLEATEDITLHADATRIASTPAINFATGKVGAAAVLGDLKGETKVQVASGANVEAGKDLGVKATSENEIDVSAYTITSTSGSYFAGTLAYAQADVTTKADVAAGAAINAGNIGIQARNENSFSTTATAMANGDGVAGAAAAISDIDVHTSATLGANLGGANGTGNLTVLAENYTESNKTSASATTGSGAVMRMMGGAAGAAGNFIQTKVGTVSDKVGNKVDGNAQNPGSALKIAAAVTVADVNLGAKAGIADNTQIDATGDVAVLAQLEDAGVRNNAKSEINAQVDKGDGKVAVSAGVAVGEFNHTAEATIGDNVRVNAKHIGVGADVKLPITITWHKWEGLDSILPKLNTNLGLLNEVLTSYASASGDSSGVGLFGSTNYFASDNNVRAWVGKGSKLTATGNRDDWATSYVDGDGDTKSWTWKETVDLQAHSLTESIDIAGNLNFLNPVSGTSSGAGGVSVGAAFNWIEHGAHTIAGIGDGVTISTSGLGVNATADDRMIVVSPTSGSGGGFGGSGIVALSRIDNTTHASISNEANITADAIVLDAAQGLSVWSAAGSLSREESAAVGIAVAVNDVTTDTKAYIGDNDEDSPSGTGTDGAKGTITTDSLSVNAITDGMVGTFAVAGAVAKSDDPNAEPGLIDRTKSNISNKVTSLRNSAADKMATMPLLSKLADKVRAAEKAPADPKQPTKPPFGIGVSGAASVNISSMDTSASIDGVTINSRSAGQIDVLTRAVTNTDLISGAGGAALAAAKNPSAKFSAGVAGAVAFNQLDNDTYAGIKNTTINDAGEVKVQALSAGDQISVGLGIALNTSQDQGKAGVAAGSVSLTMTGNSTKAEIAGSTIKGDGSGTDRVEVTAYDRARIANGGGTFTYGGRVGVGAAVSFAQIDNSAEAIIDGGHLSALDSVGVSALSASRIVNAAAMGGYGAESNSLTGAFVITDVTKDVRATVRNGAQLTTDGNVSVIASGIGRDDNLDALLHADRNNDVSFSLDRGAAEAPEAGQIIGDGRVGEDRGGEAIIGVAGQLVVGKNNIGLSFVGQSIHNTYDATIESATVNAGGDVKVAAQDTAQIIGVAVGIGGATDKFAGMGSAVANVTVNNVQARIGAEDTAAPDTSVTGANIEVKAKNSAEIYAGAGNIALSKSTALGAAVAYNETSNTTKALVNDATLKSGAGKVALDAASHSTIRGLAASGAISGTAAIGGSLNINEITDTVQARLSNADVTAGSLSVKARDRDDATGSKSSIWSLAGNISGAGKGAIGGAVSVNTVANNIDAAIDGSTLTINGMTEVDAASGSDIWSMAVAGAVSGPVAANGSVAVNTLANTTAAKVSGGSVTAANLSVTASERNDATDDRSSIWAIAGAVSGAGKATVGAASAINTVANNLDVLIANTTINVGAGSVTADTQAGAEIKSAAAAGGVAGAAAVTGAIAVNTIASNASAKANNAAITAANLSVKAQDIKSDGSAGSLIQSLAGNVNGAGTVSVGLATAVNTIANTVEAGISGSTLTVSTATTVDAKEKAKIETLATDGGIGQGAVGGSATVNNIANTTRASISNTSNIGTGNKTSIAASDSSGIDSIAGAIRIGSTAGVGAAASINRIGNTVETYLSGNQSGNAYQAKNVVLDAASDATIRTIAVGVAGGGQAGVAGSVATNILDTDVTSRIDNGAKVQADNNVGVLAENQDKIEVAAGAVGIGGMNAGVALSTVVNVVESQTKASISGATTEVTALGKDASDTLTVNTGELVSAPNIGETPDAASFAWYDLHGKTKQASGVAVNAFSTQQVGSIAASIGATLPNPKGSGAVGATAGVNVLAGATEAYVDGAKINKSNTGASAAQDVDISAGSHSYSTSFVAGASVSGDVAMGGAIDTTTISRATRAYAKNADLTASDDIAVSAQSSQGARAIGASASGAIAGGAGTAVVGVISGTTEAYLDTTTVKSIDLDVNAASRSGINLMGGALAVSGGAVGGAFAVGVSDQNTRAYIKSGQANVSGDVGVKADADTRFWNVAVSGAAGGIGVAGMAAVNVVSNTTEAYVDGANIGTSGAKANAVTVSAEDDVQVRSYGGALGAGFAPGVGAGAAANVTVVQSRVAGEVKNSHVYATNALDVKALSSVDAEHVTASAGLSVATGLSGSASLILLGNGTSGSAMSELNKDDNGVLKKIFDLSSGDKVSETDGLDNNQKDALNNSDVQASKDELANRDAARGARLGDTELSLSGGSTGELQDVNDRSSYDTSKHFASNADADVTRAAITGGTINAGSISVTATDTSRTSNVAGAAGAGFGTVGVGGGVAITRVYNDVQAVLTATNLSSGKVTLAAKAANGSGDAASATAYAGGAGPVGLGAAWADAYVENDVLASLGGSVNTTGAVSVDAQDTTIAKADSIGAAAGAGAVGISVAMAEKSSAVTAAAGGTMSNAASLDVAALSSGSVSSKSIAAAGGLFAAGTGAGADAYDRSVVRAYLANNANIKVNGATDVEATAKPQTKAEAYGVAVSGGLSIGASVAKAEADADVAAYVGNLANVTTNNLDVIARSLEPDAGQTAYAKAVGASGGYLFGANATVADASSSNTVASYVHDGANVTVPGIVKLAATNNSEQDAEALGIAAGIIAAGANVATARSNSSTDAHFDGHLTGMAAQISVTANGDDDNFAKAIAGSGGVIAGHAATAGTTNTSTTTAELQRAGSDSTIKAATVTVDAAHMARFNAEVDSVNAAVAGASAAITNHTVNTDTDAAIGTGAKVETLNVTVTATDNIRKDWLSDYNVRAAGGGIASGAAASGNITVTQSTDASVGAGAALKVVGSRKDAHLFDIAAINDFEIRDKVKLDTGGVIAVAAANNRIDVTDSQANVTIGNGATLDSVGGINLYAKTHGRAEAHANAKTYGLAGAAQGDSKALITASQTIGVGSNASLRADGEMRLGAGRAPDGTPNDIYATALTDTWNKAAAPISILSATGRVNETATIDLAKDSKLRGVTDITLLAEKGEIGGTGRYTGMDLYRKAAQEAANAVGKLVGGGESSWELKGGTSTTNGASSVVVNGLVESGIQNEQYLTIGWDKVNQTHFIELVSDEGITYKVTEETLAQGFQQRLDQLYALRDEHAGNTDAVTAYNLEIQRIESQLRALTGSGGSDFASRDVRVEFIDVAPILAAAGNIRIEGDSLSGSGSGRLISPGDAKIEVINKTPYFLRIADLIIPDQPGGLIKFNGSTVTDNASINALNPGSSGANFNQVVTGANSPEPSILVKNTFDPKAVGSGAPAGTVAPDIYINGDIRNLQGTVTVQAVAGSVVADGVINAKTINLSAGRDFVLGYTEGFRHIGGSPEGVWGDVTRKLETGEYVLYQGAIYSTILFNGDRIPFLKVADRASRSSSGALVAGNNVYISGRYLNINGTIQSGLPDWDLSIGNLDSKIAQAETTYAQRLARGNADPYVELVNWSQGNDPNQTRKVTAWWNAKENRIELDGIKVEGGYMELFGQIINTGGGQLKVLDGYGTIKINNTSGRDIALRTLDVGHGVEGTIKITDLGKRIGGNKPLTTVYKRIGSDVTVWDNTTADAYGNPTHLAKTYGNTRNLSAAQGYQPTAGERYYWVTGENFTDYEKFHEQKSSKTFFDLFPLDALFPASYSYSNPKWKWSNTGTSLAEGQYLKNISGQYDGYSYSKSSADTTGWSYGEPVKWDRCTERFIGCIERTYYAEQTRWKGSKTFYTHSVDADHGIAISFIGNDTGLIDVNSNAGVLLGGLIHNPNGTTTINAGTHIERLTGDALIISKDLNLTAGKGIGTQTVRDAFAGVNMDVTSVLTATSTTGDIVLKDISQDLRINRVTTGNGDVDVSAQNNLLMTSTAASNVIRGNQISLTATNGSIGTSGAAVNLDTGAGETGLLTASASGGIYVKETSGDLRLDTVHAGGDVYIESVNGRIIDGNRNDARDVRAEDQLLALWDDMDLVGAEADAAADKGVQAYAQGMEQEYQQYWQMRNVRKDGSGNWVADAYDAAYSFAFGPEERALLKQNGLSDVQIADIEAKKTKDYKRLHDEFGGAGYDANYKYVASATEIADIKEGAAWTTNQLKYSVSKGAFSGSGDTETRIETANVKGNNVTLVANQGGIGSTLANDVVIDLSGGIASLTNEQRIALASAERDDVSFEGPNGDIIRIVQRDDVDVETTAGGITALAKNEIFLGGEKDINVTNVQSPVVRIKAGQSIVDTQTGAPALQAQDVILEASNGSIGTDTNAFDMAVTGKFTARAQQNINIAQHNGGLLVDRLNAGGNATINVANGGLAQLHSDGVTLTAANLNLITSSGVGTSGNAVSVQHGPGGSLQATTGGDLYIASPGASLALGNSNIGGQAGITTVGTLTLSGDVQSGGNAQYAAGDDVVFGDGAKARSTAGGILITADNVVMGAGSHIEAGEDVQIVADGDVSVAQITAHLANGDAIDIDAQGRIVGDGGSDLTAASAGANVVLRAGQGIGSGAQVLSVEAPNLDASAITGNIDLHLLADTRATQILAADGAINVVADGNLGYGTIQSTGNIDLDVTGVVSGTTLSATAGSIDVQAGSANLTTVNAGDDATVNTTGAQTLGTVATGGSQTLTAGTALTAGTLNVGGALNVDSASADITMADVTGAANVTTSGNQTIGSLASGGRMTLDAGGNATYTTLDGGENLVATVGGHMQGDDADFSGNAAINAGSADLAHLQTGSGASITTTGNLTIDEVIAAASLTIDASNADVKLGLAGTTASVTTSGNQLIGSLTSGGRMTLDAGGDATYTTVNGGENFVATVGGHLHGGNADFTGSATINAGNADLAHLQTGASANVTTTGDLTIDEVIAATSLTIDAANADVTFGQADTTANVTTSGNQVIDSLSTGGRMTLDAGGDLTYAKLDGGENLVATVGGHLQGGDADFGGNASINAGSADLAHLQTGGSANVTTTGDLTIDEVIAATSLNVNAVNAELTVAQAGTTANVTTSGNQVIGSLATGGDQLLNAGGDIDFTSLLSGNDLTGMAAGAIRGGSAIAARHLTLNAGTDLNVNALTATNGRMTLDVGGNATYATLVGGEYLIAMVGGHLQGGDADFSGNAVINAGSADLVHLQTGGSANITTTGDLTIDEVIAATTLTAHAGGDATFGTATSVNDQTLHADGLLTATALTSQTGAIAIGDALNPTGSVHITAANAATTFTTHTSGNQALDTITTGGDQALNAGGAINAGTLTGGGNLDIAANELVLSSGVLAGNAGVHTQSHQQIGALDTEGSILLKTAAGGHGDIVYGRLEAGAPETVGGTEERLAAPSITVEADGDLRRLTSTTGDATAEGMLNMKAYTFDVGDLKSAGADVVLEAVVDVQADLAHAKRDLKITAGNDMRIGEVNYGGQLSLFAGRNLWAKVGGDIKFAVADVGGNADLSSGGEIAFDSLKAGGHVNLDAAGDVNVSSGVQAGESISVRSGQNVTVGALTSTAGSITIDAAGDVNAQELSATQGATDVSGNNIHVTRSSANTGDFDAVDQLRLDTVRIGERLDLAGRDVVANVFQAQPVDPLVMNVSGHAGGLADTANLHVTSDSELAFDRMYGTQIDLRTTSDRVSVADGHVPGRLTMETPMAKVVVENTGVSPQKGVNVQLHEMDFRFWLKQAGKHTDTSAYVLRYDPGYTVAVPNFSEAHTDGGPMVRGESALIFAERLGSMQRNAAVSGSEDGNGDGNGEHNPFEELLWPRGLLNLDGIFAPTPLPLTLPDAPAVNVGGTGNDGIGQSGALSPSLFGGMTISQMYFAPMPRDDEEEK